MPATSWWARRSRPRARPRGPSSRSCPNHHSNPREGAMARSNGSSDIIVAWLRDAYAMEKALVPVLENHAKDAERHPTVRSRIEQHAAETRRHAELVAQCLRQLGEEPSTVKNTMAQALG